MVFFLLHLLLLPCPCAVAAGASKDTHKVTVKPGEDVTLQCHAQAAIEQLEWSRADLKSDKYVFFCRINCSVGKYQLSSYHGRVELIDPKLKDGNASLILKNVTINDTGTYECRIGVSSTTHGKKDKPELKSTIKLTVQDPGHKDGHIDEGDKAEGETDGGNKDEGETDGGNKDGGNKDEGNNYGLIIDLIVGGILVVVVVLGFVIYKKRLRHTENAHQPPADEEAGQQLETLM